MLCFRMPPVNSILPRWWISVIINTFVCLCVWVADLSYLMVLDPMPITGRGVSKVQRAAFVDRLLSVALLFSNYPDEGEPAVNQKKKNNNNSASKLVVSGGF